MDRDTPLPLEPERPLDVDEAKFQLRAAASDVNVNLTGFVQRHPWTAVGLAMAAGALLGGSPAARNILSKALVKKLMDMV